MRNQSIRKQGSSSNDSIFWLIKDFVMALGRKNSRIISDMSSDTALTNYTF